MIIRYTKAEQQELNRIEKYYDSQINNLYDFQLNHINNADHSGSIHDPEVINTDKEIRRIEAERAASIRAKIKEFEDIRFSKISRSPQKIKDNAQTQTTAIIKKLQQTVEHYKPESPEERKQRFESLEGKTDFEILDMIEPFPNIFYGIIPEVESTEGEVARLEADQIIDIIKKDLYRHYEKLSTEDCNDLDTFIEQAVYEALEKQPGQALEVPTAYFRTYHDPFSDTLPQISKYILRDGPSENELFVTVGSVRVNIKNPQGLEIALGVPSHKLIITALMKFTEKPSRNTVMIPTREYFELVGYNTSNQRTFEKCIERTADYLRTLRLLDVEIRRSKGRKKGFSGSHIVIDTNIDSNDISITLHPEYAKYLRQNGIQMQFPKALLKLSGKSPNAYRIGVKMVLHFSNYNNIIRGSNNILEVSSLLNITDLPLIETIREQSGSWIRKIRNPFENALDKLVEGDVISKWYYCKAKSRKLNPQERETARSKYENWERCYIHFELKDPPDQSEAVQRNRERKLEATLKTQNDVPG